MTDSDERRCERKKGPNEKRKMTGRPVGRCRTNELFVINVVTQGSLPVAETAQDAANMGINRVGLWFVRETAKQKGCFFLHALGTLKADILRDTRCAMQMLAGRDESFQQRCDDSSAAGLVGWASWYQSIILLLRWHLASRVVRKNVRTGSS